MICVGVEAGEPLPADVETRLARFAELLTTAIANADARDDLHRLAEEQAALRRLATLAAEGGGTGELFAAVVEAVAQVVGVPGGDARPLRPGRVDDGARLVRRARRAGWPVGSRWPLDGPSVARQIRETGRPARIDDYSALPGAIAGFYREQPRHADRRRADRGRRRGLGDDRRRTPDRAASPAEMRGPAGRVHRS